MENATSIVLATLVFVAGLGFILFKVGYRLGFQKSDAHWSSNVKTIRKDAANRARAVLGGQFSENLAPWLPGFPFSPNECRFMGAPIDFIVFRGSDEKAIQEVIFVEVKTGSSKLSSQEKYLKQAIESGRVTWFEYRVPPGVVG